MVRIGISCGRLAWAALALPAVLALPAAAQAPLDLKQAVEAAWSRQPEARSAPQRREAVAAQRQTADAWTPEPVSLESSLRTDRFTSNNGAREIEIGIGMPLWLPGERARSRSLADAELNSLDARQRVALWRVVGIVREAWWSVHSARQDVAAAHVRLASAEKLAGDVARRLRAGDLALADQHQADAAVAAAQAELATSLAAQTQASNTLRAHVVGASAELMSAEPEPEPPAQAAADALHPAIADWATRAEAARRTQALAAAQTRGNPELTLLTTRDRGVAGEPYGQTITLGVRIPFGSDARSRGKAAGAAADLVEAESALELERDKLVADIDAARARVAAARSVLQAHERRAALARETVGFIDKSFRLGETDLPTRLRVELDAVEAQRLSARSRIELAHSISSLRQALGLPAQ